MVNVEEKDIVEAFHKLYYSSGGRTWSGNTRWLGFPVLKCPLDLWIYQEIIFENRPDVIIETGTGSGGGALFLASICDTWIDNGNIITIDTENTNHEKDLPKHDRIKYLTGTSISGEILESIENILKSLTVTYGDQKVMVILDSDHSKEHVLRELELYSPLVTAGQYIIVEDTNLDHPNPVGFVVPMEAVNEFLKNNGGFIVDESKHKFYLTFNPRGYLKKIGGQK